MNADTQVPSPALYVCKACGVSHRWVVRCPKCQAWSAAGPQPVPQSLPAARPAQPALARELLESYLALGGVVDAEPEPRARIEGSQLTR